MIVSTTLAELEAAAHGGVPANVGPAPSTEQGPVADPAALTGWAVTAGGSFLPMSDLLRMASHSYHYLCVFDGKGRALWLGRSKRLASADQRIVLYARDKGGTRPGCTASAYRCQADHHDNFSQDGETNVDELGLDCGPDNRMAYQQNWTVRLNTEGRVEWIPPPHLDRGQPRVNPYHQPADMLARFRRRFRRSAEAPR